MIEKELLKLGLSEKEIKVYLAAMELGPKPVQEIARRANINRVTCYVILENLLDFGLVTQIEGEKGKIYAAENPEKLLQYLDKKEREIESTKKEISEILPELLAMFNRVGDRPVVRYLEGVEGIRGLQEQILESGTQHIDSIVSLDYAFKHYSPQEFNDYRKELIKRKIKIRGITTSKKYTHEYMPKGHEEDQKYRFLPADKFEFPGEIGVFDDFASIFSYTGKPVLIIIEHPQVVKILQSWFDLAWKGTENYASDEYEPKTSRSKE